MYEHGDIKLIEQKLSKKFLNACFWLVNKKLSIHFGEDKTKSIVWHKKETRKDSNLEFRYDTKHIKQYHTATYLGYRLDENLSGEPIDFQAIKKSILRSDSYIGK